jgi:hypothetical protein
VAEPANEPETNALEDATVYRDEPDMGGAARDEPPDAADSDPGGDRVTTATQAQQGDDRAEIDSGDPRGPVIIQGGRYSGGEADQPPPRSRQASPERGWRDAPPDPDQAPLPRYSRVPPPDSADDDPRYRY